MHSKIQRPIHPGKKIDEPEEIVLVGAKEFVYKTKHASYRVSAGSFFQVNRHLADELISIVTEGTVWEGRHSIFMRAADFFFSPDREFERVIAVEASQTSQTDLVYNSPANVKAFEHRPEQY